MIDMTDSDMCCHSSSLEDTSSWQEIGAFGDDNSDDRNNGSNGVAL